MKKLFGSPGKVSGLALRIGQCCFAAAAIGVMLSAHGFFNATAFCYLIASMGLQVVWSFGLACLDLHALRSKRSLQNPILVSLFVVGDWVSDVYSVIGSCMLISGGDSSVLKRFELLQANASSVQQVPNRRCLRLHLMVPPCCFVHCHVSVVRRGMSFDKTLHILQSSPVNISENHGLYMGRNPVQRGCHGAVS
ncbi:CASP-like protein [Pyrus ussuriensis x Pyrus communis]|uniref:CASP-like protein n=1 Tax=Pyrus ussuriensis x Pyrus communis TaxID=2448454 RepID=A0A5N5FH07_9ROSA|nr:CASP-like protein [Pyrus ussuriensis x Pyrus communis]